MRLSQLSEIIQKAKDFYEGDPEIFVSLGAESHPAKLLSISLGFTTPDASVESDTNLLLSYHLEDSRKFSKGQKWKNGYGKRVVICDYPLGASVKACDSSGCIYYFNPDGSMVGFEHDGFKSLVTRLE